MSAEKVLYFEKPGEANTDEALKIALDYAKTHGVNDIVVASTRGSTALRAASLFKGFNLVVVTHESWFRRDTMQEFSVEARRKLESMGVKIVTAAHAFRGVGRSFRDRYGGAALGDVIADTLRLFCEGVKVCVEIVLMAADAGLIPLNQDVLSIAGTGRGADTVLLVKPTTSTMFHNLKIRKILAKPL